MNIHCVHDNIYKGKNLIVAGLLFRDLVQCYHGRKHGTTEAHMVLLR